MLTGGRPLRLFASALTRALAGATDILDVGTSQRFAKELRPFQHLFHNLNYRAAGYKPSRSFGAYNCDFDEDVQHLSFPDAQFDVVICLEVLEHVRDPFSASHEIIRVLRDGGRLLLTVPFIAGYHGKAGTSASHDEYPDLWRFTEEGLRQLFAPLRELEIRPLYGPVATRLHGSRAWNLLNNPIVSRVFDRFDRPRDLRFTARWLVLGTK
jgi:SAM-dependent methyltransferase